MPNEDLLKKCLVISRQTCDEVECNPEQTAEWFAELLEQEIASRAELLVDAWRVEARDVMFNKAGDDLTPAGRVEKWLREHTDSAANPT